MYPSKKEKLQTSGKHIWRWNLLLIKKLTCSDSNWWIGRPCVDLCHREESEKQKKGCFQETKGRCQWRNEVNLGIVDSESQLGIGESTLQRLQSGSLESHLAGKGTANYQSSFHPWLLWTSSANHRFPLSLSLPGFRSSQEIDRHPKDCFAQYINPCFLLGCGLQKPPEQCASWGHEQIHHLLQLQACCSQAPVAYLKGLGGPTQGTASDVLALWELMGFSKCDA